MPAEDAYNYTDWPVFIEGVAYKTNAHLLSRQMYSQALGLERYDICDFASPHIAVEEAYKMAGITARDVDFAEVFESHITSLLPTLAATRVPDKLLDFVIKGETGPGGRLPTGTNGGCGGFGLTSGSNFSDHVYEAVHQMRGDTGERQLKKTDVAVIVGMQGEMASSAAAVLRNGRKGG